MKTFPRLLALLLLTCPALLSAQTPVGGPIQVAAAATGRPNEPHLQEPAVAMNPRGDFVAGWTRLSPKGNLAGRLAVAPDGSFLVVWGEVELPDNRLDSLLKGRLFNAGGTPQGPIFLISDRLSETTLTGYDTAVDEDGNFLVTWLQSRFSPVPQGLSAFVRRYAPDASPLGGPAPAGHRPAGQEIAATPGGFVSTWKPPSNDPSRVVVSRSAATGGSPGPLVQLGTALPHSSGPVLAGNGTGSFVAAWLAPLQGSKGSILVVQRLRAE